MKFTLDYRAWLCIALSLMAGWTCAHFRLPLAWVLGPLVVTAAFAMADVPVFASVKGRRLGQLVIGASVGLNLTGEVLFSLLGWLPLMVLSALVSVIVAAALSVCFARAARLDQTTSFFAMVPGGMSEMANIGFNQGARSEAVALSQALRVGIVVCCLPPLIIMFGGEVDLGGWAAKPLVPLESVPFVFLFAVAGALTFRLVSFQNPWMVGSLLGVSLLAATDTVTGRLPIPLVNAGQFMLGIAIGARFKGDIVKRLPRLSLISALFTLILTAAMAVYSAAVAEITGLTFSSMMLSTAPGGFAEMVLTAQVLHLQVAVVTAFHIIRSLMINGLVLKIWTLLNRMRFFDGIDTLLRRVI